MGATIYNVGQAQLHHLNRDVMWAIIKKLSAWFKVFVRKFRITSQNDYLCDVSSTYNCFDIAKEFLIVAKEESESVTNMKLLKMTYIAHGYHLAFFDKPLFYNQIQAWKYGPVIPDLYQVTKRFGDRPVDVETIDLWSANEMDIGTSEFVRLIWKHYKKYNALQLSSKTHQQGTPWAQAFDGRHFVEIENKLILEYYKKMISVKTS